MNGTGYTHRRMISRGVGFGLSVMNIPNGYEHKNAGQRRVSDLQEISVVNHFIRTGTLNPAMALVLSIYVALAGCSGVRPDAASTVTVPPYVEQVSDGVWALNYTPWYIHTFAIEGPKGSRIGGGGPNVWPIEPGSTKPSGGGKEVCCMTFPLESQPDLRLTVRWLVDKKGDGKTPGYWYKAENVRIPPYDGRSGGGVWGVFLPHDRVRIMIADGNHNGGNNPYQRPPDDDPYIARGAIDEEWNRLYRKGGMQ